MRDTIRFSNATRVGGLLASLSVLAACGTPAPSVTPADLVLRNGVVVTVDESIPDAEAIAVTGYTITAVGTNAEIEPYIGETTEVVDLEGRLAVPGFIEGHGHYMSLGESKVILDLNNVRDWDEIVTMVADAVQEAEPGEWVEGRGWHQEKWESVPAVNVDGVPLHNGLSEVSPDNPVHLGHASGHASFANARAMELAGIDRDTADPRAGPSFEMPTAILPGCCGKRRNASSTPASRPTTPTGTRPRSTPRCAVWCNSRERKHSARE